MARHPDIDLVTVSVKVPDHYRPVMAAIEPASMSIASGRSAATPRKPSACSMPRSDAACGMRSGLQGQMSPAINYVKDLIADGYVGRVLTATMIGCAPNWGAAIDRAYQADRANGANLMTITGGHQIDALCHCLGEFRELTAFAVSQRDRIPLEGTGEIVAKDTPDQLVVNGIVGGKNAEGAVVSFQIRGGMTRGTEFLFEIHGDRGDLVADRHHARLDAASGTDGPRAPRAPRRSLRNCRSRPGIAGFPTACRGTPGTMSPSFMRVWPKASAQGTPASPSFAAAVTRHRLLDAIMRASETGQKQVL